MHSQGNKKQILLKRAFDKAVKGINFIKRQLLSIGLFDIPCEEQESTQVAEHQAALVV